MGWQRKIVRVNMTERTALIEPLNMDWAFQSKRPHPLVARLKVLSGYASIVRSEDRWHPNGYLPKIPAEEILINVPSFLISAGCTPGKRD